MILFRVGLPPFLPNTPEHYELMPIFLLKFSPTAHLCHGGWTLFFVEIGDFLFYFCCAVFPLIIFLGWGLAPALYGVVSSLLLYSVQIQGLVHSTPGLSPTYLSPLTTTPPGSDDILRVWDSFHYWIGDFTLMRCDFSCMFY